MNLQLKVIIILASMWAALAFFTYQFSHAMLSKEYARLETKAIISDMQKTQNTLNHMLTSVKTILPEWAEWDDAYRFMRHKNETFIKSNLLAQTFLNAKINLILFFDTAGKFYAGKNYNFIQQRFEPIPQDLLNRLSTLFTSSSLPHQAASTLGLINTSAGQIMLSAMPILMSDGKGPANGILVMGYFFNDFQIQALADLVNTQLTFYTLPISHTEEDVNDAYQALQSGQRYYVAPKNQHVMHGYTLIHDINHRTTGILRVTVSRDGYNQGIQTINDYLFIILGLGLIFLITTWFLLKAFVLNRVISVSKQAINISTESKFSQRIHLQGKDELSNMVAAINSLMEIIEITQEQLKHRILLRTEELQRLSQLNKTLYSEMDQQKQIESELREGERMLRQLAYYDSLTGLPNRIYFHEILQNKLAKAERNGTSFVVLFLDADRFKYINDTYGHDIGDKYLAHIAQQLRSSIKEGDVAARLAGDEFILIIENIRNPDIINKMAEKLLKQVSVPLNINNTEIHSTFSIGICIYPDDGKSIEELEKHADLAMYYAKKQSGMTYCYYQHISTPITMN